jgi:hypothetical protein
LTEIKALSRSIFAISCSVEVSNHRRFTFLLFIPSSVHISSLKSCAVYYNHEPQSVSQKSRFNPCWKIHLFATKTIVPCYLHSPFRDTWIEHSSRYRRCLQSQHSSLNQKHLKFLGLNIQAHLVPSHVLDAATTPTTQLSP